MSSRQMKSSGPKLLSVVMPAHANGYSLKRVLGGLAQQSLEREKFEVIVIDDGSKDSLAREVAPFQKAYDLTFVRYAKNRGRAAARNQGLALSRGERILLLDSDSFPGRELLKRHALAKDPVLLGWRYEPDLQDLPAILKGKRPWDKASAAEEDMRHGLFSSPQGRASFSLAPWYYFWSHNVSFMRRLLQRSGRFDEDFVRYGNEDIELGYRMFLAGNAEGFAVDRAAHCYHLPHLRSWAENLSGLDQNLKMFVKKHPSMDVELTSLYFGETYFQVLERLKNRLRSLQARSLKCSKKMLRVRNGLELRIARRAAGASAPWLSDPLCLPEGGALRLLGLFTPFEDRAFARVTNAELWAATEPTELEALVREGLRIASCLELWGERPVTRFEELATTWVREHCSISSKPGRLILAQLKPV